MNGPIVVVGDTLLDREVVGAVSRLSPEAPVPVLDEVSTSDRPGGAGLAAALGAGQGREVILVTALADDAGGARLSELLAAAGVELYPMLADGATPEKIRLRTDERTLLRLDRGGASGPGRSAEPGEAVRRAIAGAAVILVSDYGRGVARDSALRSAIAESPAPVVWDPHPRGPAPVPGARLATPNEPEACQLADERRGGGHRLAAIARAGEQLRRRWRSGAVAVTMAADGVLLCHAGPTPLAIPPPAHADREACGAGDRFAVSAARALADGATVNEAVARAVSEATAYVAGGEPVPSPVGERSPARLGRQATGELVARVRRDGGRVVATGGCFDLLHAGHLASLEAARRLGDCLVVCLNSDAGVAALKGPGRPVINEADRGRLLAGLRCVDAVVIFDEPAPDAVLSWLRPDVWVKGGDYLDGDGNGELPESGLVQRWGGQAVLVPYLDGRSTTTLIGAARGGNGRHQPEGSS